MPWWIAEIRVLLYTTLLTSHMFQTKNPASLMAFGAVTSDRSVMNRHFIAAELNIGTKDYQDILKTFLLPWMEQNIGLIMWYKIKIQHKVISQKQHRPFFIKRYHFFMRADIWPSNSPDLNLLDYFLWGLLQARTNVSPHVNLKTCLVRATRKIKRVEVEAAAKQFHSRVKAVIALEGGHIE